MMTAYDQLMAEGMQKGKEEGIAELLQKTVLNAFGNGFDVAIISLITGESREK